MRHSLDKNEHNHIQSTATDAQSDTCSVLGIRTPRPTRTSHLLTCCVLFRAVSDQIGDGPAWFRTKVCGGERDDAGTDFCQCSSSTRNERHRTGVCGRAHWLDETRQFKGAQSETCPGRLCAAARAFALFTLHRRTLPDADGEFSSVCWSLASC